MPAIILLKRVEGGQEVDRVKGNVCLILYPDVLDKERKEAEKRAKADSIDGLLWSDLELSIDEMRYEDGLIIIDGAFYSNGKEFGYVSITIPIDLELTIEITQDYIKRLNKLKSVLEAVK